MALTKDDIVVAIATRKRELHELDVPEWGGAVYLRRLTINDVEKSGLAEDKRDKSTIIYVLAASLCDADGNLLFESRAASAALQDIDVSLMTRIFAEALKVNGLLSEELEEAVADFADAQPGSSSSS